MNDMHKTFKDLLLENNNVSRYYLQHQYDMWHQSAITISYLLSKIKNIEDPVYSEIIELMTEELHKAVEKENKIQQRMYIEDEDKRRIK